MRSGERLGQYELLDPLGRGASAEVWRARHAGLGSLHAVKILAVSSPQLARRLLLEGRVQARLRHPNIVPVTDLIQRGSLLALVMDFIPGGSLLDRLRAGGPMPPEQVRGVLGAVLDGLDFAHRAGVLHRDLKLANVLLDGDTPRIADFGLARQLAPGQPGMTRADQALGTPGYMPPEQWAEPAEIDARADLFALGVIAYELLTGSSPFAGADPTEVLEATLSGRFIPPRRLVPGCPGDLAAAIERALSPGRERRFPHCRAMAEALSLHLSERPIPATPPAGAPPGAPGGSETLVAAPEIPIDAGPGVMDGGAIGRIAPAPERARPRTGGRSRARLLAAAGLLLGLAGGASWWLGRPRGAAGGAPAEHAADTPAAPSDIPPCAGGDDELLGYWYPGRRFRAEVGDTITVGVLSHVREDYPRAENGWRGDAPIRCALQPGQRLHLREPPLPSRRGRSWLALYGGDLR